MLIKTFKPERGIFSIEHHGITLPKGKRKMKDFLQFVVERNDGKKTIIPFIGLRASDTITDYSNNEYTRMFIEQKAKFIRLEKRL